MILNRETKQKDQRGLNEWLFYFLIKRQLLFIFLFLLLNKEQDSFFLNIESSIDFEMRDVIYNMYLSVIVKSRYLRIRAIPEQSVICNGIIEYYLNIRSSFLSLLSQANFSV